MEERELATLLERRGERITGIRGVVGTGIGEAAGEPGQPCIRVYVEPGTDRDEIRKKVRDVTGDQPIDVVEMEIPEAQGD
jgi:hypothetical protein